MSSLTEFLSSRSCMDDNSRGRMTCSFSAPCAPAVSTAESIFLSKICRISWLLMACWPSASLPGSQGCSSFPKGFWPFLTPRNAERSSKCVEHRKEASGVVTMSLEPCLHHLHLAMITHVCGFVWGIVIVCFLETNLSGF